jgi:hypothetical protein
MPYMHMSWLAFSRKRDGSGATGLSAPVPPSHYGFVFEQRRRSRRNQVRPQLVPVGQQHLEETALALAIIPRTRTRAPECSRASLGAAHLIQLARRATIGSMRKTRRAGTRAPGGSTTGRRALSTALVLLRMDCRAERRYVVSALKTCRPPGSRARRPWRRTRSPTATCPA